MPGKPDRKSQAEKILLKLQRRESENGDWLRREPGVEVAGAFADGACPLFRTHFSVYHYSAIVFSICSIKVSFGIRWALLPRRMREERKVFVGFRWLAGLVSADNFGIVRDYSYYLWQAGVGTGVTAIARVCQEESISLKMLGFGAVAKWLRQRIANPPPRVRIPPAPLFATLRQGWLFFCQLLTA